MRKNLNQNLFFKILLIALLLLNLTLIQAKKLTKEDKDREKYYSKILQESIKIFPDSPDLKLSWDEEGLYLSTQSEYTYGTQLAYIDKKHVISGCDFYPFKDYIISLLIKNIQLNPHQNPNTIIPLFSMTYYLLYLRFGNKEKAVKYYGKRQAALKINLKSAFYFEQFGLKEEYKIFMSNMEFDTFSALNFSEEDLQFAKQLGMNLSHHKTAADIYNFILTQVQSDQMEEEMREILMSFVNNFSFFKKYLDITFRKGVNIKVQDYSHVFQKDVQEGDYATHQKLLTAKFNYSNEVCQILMPLLDLMRHVDGKIEPIRADLTLKANKGFIFNLSENFKNFQPLGYTLNINDIYKNNEILYLDYGTNVFNQEKRFEGLTVTYKFDKENFTEKRAIICKAFKCCDFDVDVFYYQKKLKTMEHPIKIVEGINLSFLNIFKLIQMNESKLHVSVHPYYFQQFKKFDFNTECKALEEYINFMKESSLNLGFEKLVQDLELLEKLEKILLKKISFKESKKQEELVYTIKNKINLIKIALDKKIVYSRHLNSLYNEYENFVIADLGKIKENFFKA